MAKAKKSKGFLSRAASLLGSIPAVGNVRNAAKKVGKAKKTLKKTVKKATKTAKRVVKSTKKKVKKSVKKKKKTAAKLKKGLKKAKKKAKRKVKKKLRKKVGKVFTKARKLKNNLSKSKRVTKLKKQMKKTVLKAKKSVKKVKSTAKKVSKSVVQNSKKLSKKITLGARAVNEFVKNGFNGRETASAIADFIPIVGNVKGAYEATFGKDPITGRKLGKVERAAAGAAVIGGPLVKGGTRSVKVVSGIVSGGKKKTNITNFDVKAATNKQKGNYGEIVSSNNILNNPSLKEAGYDLKPIGRGAPSSVNDKIVHGIDGLYENQNAKSPIKYVIDEAKFGSSQLSKTPKDGPQMSDSWLTGEKTGKSRIEKAVGGDRKLARNISLALADGKVERVLSKVDSSGTVKTFRLDKEGNIIGDWP